MNLITRFTSIVRASSTLIPALLVLLSLVATTSYCIEPRYAPRICNNTLHKTFEMIEADLALAIDRKDFATEIINPTELQRREAFEFAVKV